MSDIESEARRVNVVGPGASMEEFRTKSLPKYERTACPTWAQFGLLIYCDR